MLDVWMLRPSPVVACSTSSHGRTRSNRRCNARGLALVSWAVHQNSLDAQPWPCGSGLLHPQRIQRAWTKLPPHENGHSRSPITVRMNRAWIAMASAVRSKLASRDTVGRVGRYLRLAHALKQKRKFPNGRVLRPQLGVLCAESSMRKKKILPLAFVLARAALHLM